MTAGAATTAAEDKAVVAPLVVVVLIASRAARFTIPLVVVVRSVVISLTPSHRQRAAGRGRVVERQGRGSGGGGTVEEDIEGRGS